MSSLLLSPSDLLDQVSESFYRRGADYQRSGRVLSSATQQRERSDIVTGRAVERGGYGKASRFNGERALEPYPAGFLLDSDIEILLAQI